MKNEMYIILTLIPLLAGCGDKKEAARGTMPVPEISVASPVVKDITLTKEYPGYLSSEKTVDLVARVNGTLQTIAYAPGSRVRKGQVLFVIEPTIYQDNVEQAEAELNKAFKEKWVDKFYNAVVVGRPNVSQAQLKAFLFKDAKKSLAIVSKTAKPGYVPIETHYRVLKQSGEVCLLEVRLITGRTHQIRAHLASEKLPVLGDGKYGINQINKKYRQNRQMLACVRLQFSFPKNSPLSYLNKRPIRLDADLLAQLKG